MTKVTKEQHEALHVLGKALNDAKKTAFRYDHTRPNAEINAEIDAAVEAELSRDKLYGYIRTPEKHYGRKKYIRTRNA